MPELHVHAASRVSASPSARHFCRTFGGFFPSVRHFCRSFGGFPRLSGISAEALAGFPACPAFLLRLWRRSPHVQHTPKFRRNGKSHPKTAYRRLPVKSIRRLDAEISSSDVCRFRAASQGREALPRICRKLHQVLSAAARSERISDLHQCFLERSSETIRTTSVVVSAI